MPPSRGLGTTTGEVNLEVTPERLFEDMERLRRIVECMEETMPVNVRKTITFFKRNRAATGKEIEAKVFELNRDNEDAQQRVLRVEEVLAREHANLHKALRHYEKELENMKGKVEDIFKQLPKALPIMKPLQAAIRDGSLESSQGDEAAKSDLDKDGPALKPLKGFIDAALQHSIGELRRDLLEKQSEIRAELGRKASEKDFTLLKDRVHRWARAPSREGGDSPKRPGTSLGFSAEKGKMPTCPATPSNVPLHASQSAGRLPVLALNRTR